MTTWADIQRLASDLQRVQLSTVSQRLTESNCVELVSRLLKEGLIDVVYTRDGSAYITREHLATLVVNEVVAAGGRRSAVDVAAALNVHLEYVEGVLGGTGGIMLTNGELISRDYVGWLHSQLRSLLSECGLRPLAWLSRHWDLPVDTLLHFLCPLPQDLGAVLDKEEIYSWVWMAAQRNNVRALFSALTKVTSVAVVAARSSLPPTRFMALVDELLDEKEIAGRLVGSRSSTSAIFIPTIHDNLVEKYVKRHLQEKEFIDTALLRKLMLGDSKSGLKKVAGDKIKLRQLPSLVCTEEVAERLEKLIRDELGLVGVADGRSISHDHFEVPFSTDDIDSILTQMASKDKGLTVHEGLVFSSTIMRRSLDAIKMSGKLQEKAKQWMEAKLNKKEAEVIVLKEQKKVAAAEEDDNWEDKGKKGKGKKVCGGSDGGERPFEGGGGGGAKAPKAPPKKEVERGAECTVTVEEVEQWLEGVPDQLREVVAEAIHSEVEGAARAAGRELVAAREQEAQQSSKKVHQQMRLRAQCAYERIVVAEGGASSFPDGLARDLRSFLLKSLCSDLASELLNLASSSPQSAKLTQKQRDETLASLGNGPSTAFSALLASLKGDSLDSFHDSLKQVCSRSVCDIVLDAVDKESRTAATQLYISELEAAAGSEEPAVVLLSLVLLAYARQGVVVHASGKFVSQLLPLLADRVDPAVHSLMVEGQAEVVGSIKAKGGDGQRLAEVLGQLKQLLQQK